MDRVESAAFMRPDPVRSDPSILVQSGLKCSHNQHYYDSIILSSLVDRSRVTMLSSNSSCGSFGGPSSNSSFGSLSPRFPTEITEKILGYCDGVTLFLAKESDAICLEIVEKRIKWRLKCQEELSLSILEELLLKMYPKYWCNHKDYIVDWLDVYKSHLRWGKFKPGKPENVFKSLSAINCIEVSGDVVLIGCKTGVQALHLINNNLQTVFEGSEVTNIELFCTKLAPLFNETLDGCLHDFVDILLRPKFHFIIDLHKKFHPSRRLLPKLENCYTRYHKDLAFYVLSNGSMSEMLLYKDGLLIHKTTEPKICEWKGIGFSENTISYIIVNSAVETRNHDFEVLVTDKNVQKDLPRSDDCLCGCISYLSFKLTFWYGEVLIATTMCSRLYVNIKNKEAIYDPLNKTITAVALQQKILLLGTDVGVVYLYQMQTEDDLLNLDLEAFEASIDVTNDPIKCLKFYQRGSLPGILIATKNCLYKISFNAPD